jgi:hypothetical protein
MSLAITDRRGGGLADLDKMLRRPSLTQSLESQAWNSLNYGCNNGQKFVSVISGNLECLDEI